MKSLSGYLLFYDDSISDMDLFAWGMTESIEHTFVYAYAGNIFVVPQETLRIIVQQYIIAVINLAINLHALQYFAAPSMLYCTCR